MEVVLSRTFAVAVWAVLATATAASADTSSTALHAEGQQLYHAEKYLEAAEKFRAAYDLDPDPAYLFNAAQAFRLGNDCAKAADAYRRFLEVVPSPPEPEKLRRYVEEMDACVRARMPPLEPRVDVPPAPPRIEEPPRQEPRTAGGNAKRTLGVAAGIAGLAAVGTGIWFSWDTRFLARRYERACEGATIEQPCDGAALQDYDRRGHRAERLAIAGYVVGGVALLGGITLFVLGRDAGDEPAVSLAPRRGGALVMTGWAF